MEARTEEVLLLLPPRTLPPPPSSSPSFFFVAAASRGNATSPIVAAQAARTFTGTFGNQNGVVSLSSSEGKTAAKKTLPTAPAASSFAAASAMV